MHLHELAGQAYDALETATRPDSDETYVRTKDDAPQWVNDLVYEAHGGMLPDDWRYATIHAALGYLHDTGVEDADSFDSHGFADGNVDVYNGARTAWLASNLTRAGYCDEAAAEFGGATDIMDMIGMGQYAESAEIIGSVLQSLQDQLDVLNANEFDEGAECENAADELGEDN